MVPVSECAQQYAHEQTHQHLCLLLELLLGRKQLALILHSGLSIALKLKLKFMVLLEELLILLNDILLHVSNSTGGQAPHNVLLRTLRSCSRSWSERRKPSIRARQSAIVLL